MFSTTDTIVAIATPPGRGGIGVVRISGPDAAAVACRMITHAGPLEARHATHTFATRGGERIDEVVATFFPTPRSYTGEDVVELSAHGSPVVLEALVAEAIAGGARLAEPGEFTLRAFLNGRIDLPQAEAVADLIDAVTPLQARAAFDQLQGTMTAAIGGIETALFELIARLEASIDFPDEGYHFAASSEIARDVAALQRRTSDLVDSGRRGRVIREGRQVAIVGLPNVGKSSLFNALVGTERAIVAETPGTTRDVVTEAVDIHGLRVTLVDTAGIRAPGDVVEAEGVSRARCAAQAADLLLHVRDASSAREPAELGYSTNSTRHLVVWNKIDRPEARLLTREPTELTVSAATGEGMEALREAIASALTGSEIYPDPASVTNIRHLELLSRADVALGRAACALGEDPPPPEELVLADLQSARAALEEVSGRRTAEDLLEHIFSRFCVGK